MKKKTPILLCLLIALSGIASGQNVITLDLSGNTFVNPAPIDPAKSIRVKFAHLPDPNEQVTINFQSNTAGPVLSHQFRCDTGALLQVPKDLPGTSLSYTMNFKFLTSGNTFGIAINLDNSYTFSPAVPGTTNTTGSALPDLFDKTKFDQLDMTEQDYIKKYNNLIIYYADKNTWNVYRDHNKKQSFWYRYKQTDNGNGVVFLIQNFNTIKYTVSTTNTFLSSTNSIPDIFTSVGSIITSGNVAANGATGFSMDQVIYLNQQMKEMMKHRTGDFVGAKAGFSGYVKTKFNGDINASYLNYKNDYIAKKQVTVKTYNSDQFNKDVMATYNMVLSADSVVKATAQLYDQIISSPFAYQSNVIQLQNADQLQFTVNISPTPSSGSTTSNGAFNITSQNITVPILGGWKFDFSTGFYYSYIKNDNYVLRKNQKGDTTKSSIVRENNFGGGTIGIDGLLHAYFRFSDGITPALTFGVGKSLDLNYSLLGGVSALVNVTGQNKIGLTYGMAYSSVKGPSKSQQNADGSFIQQPSSVTSVAYTNRFRWGQFISFSYTFGLTKASQPAAPASSTTSTPGSTPATGAAPSGGGGGGGKGGGKSATGGAGSTGATGATPSQ